MAKKNLSTGNFGVGTLWTPTVVNPAVQEWANKENTDWRLTPAARSKVAGGATKSTAVNRKPESSEEYTKRRIKEETQRTWRSDVADTLHGIGEGVLALHPYTAIPYYGAKVGQDFLNGNLNWGTALNASIPLFHLSPQAVGLREATNVALEDAANAGSKTARNWRVAREINLTTRNKPNLSNRTISVKRSNNEITGQPDLVYTLYNEFGEPIGLTNIGGAVFGSGNKTHRMVDGVMSMRNAHKVSEDTYNAAVQDIIDNGGKGLESGWSLMMPLKTLAVTSKFPHTVIGLEFGNPVRLLTGTSKRSIPQKVLGNHYLELKPSFEIKYNESTGNFERIPIVNLEPYVSTSLKFFERKPSRISEAERVGIPKGERNLPFKAKVSKITVDNAASITPAQWTAAQDAAIARGDMAEAQRLRDLHFKVSAPNTKVVDTKGNPQLVIHKTPNDFTVFDNSRSIGNLNWAATPKAFEGENGVFATGAGPNPKDMPLYVNMRNPHYPTIEEGMEPAFINEGEDGILGIVDKDMTDYFESSSKAGEGFNMSLGVDNPYALKSADAVTYDNNGVRIPLGERDNFNINDIRYGLLPFGIGLTGYGLYKRKLGGKMNTLLFLKNGSGIHIKKKNRGKFTDYCGGKVTDACIRKAKASGNPTLVKRATFAANVRKWKHLKGGILQNGAELGGLVGEAVKRVAKANAAKLWFESRYLPINWNNMKYIYNQMKLAGIPYDTTIAVMGNIIHESQGNPNKRQIGGGPGYGLIQWNKGTEPGDTLELQTQGIINNLINPSGLNNYWYHGGEGSGFKSGEDVRLYMNQKNNYEFSRKTKAFSDSLLRPGKPEMSDRIKSARSLAALQDLFPEYLKGGII